MVRVHATNANPPPAHNFAMNKHDKEIHDIEQYVNPANWRWRRWMVRSDGKVFWQYSQGYELWVDWDVAIKKKSQQSKANRQYHSLNREKRRQYYWENKEWHNAFMRGWYQSNKVVIRPKRAKYQKERVKNDPLFAVKNRLRARVWAAISIKGYTKRSSIGQILGANWQTVICHLESQFTDGMTWENRSAWHIDHIKPLASATTEDELIALCHYTNLQPLWAADNLRKGAN